MCFGGRLKRMPASAVGFSDALLDGTAWNACPSAMVWAASLAVTTHSSRGVAGEAVGTVQAGAGGFT